MKKLYTLYESFDCKKTGNYDEVEKYESELIKEIDKKEEEKDCCIYKNNTYYYIDSNVEIQNSIEKPLEHFSICKKEGNYLERVFQSYRDAQDYIENAKKEFDLFSIYKDDDIIFNKQNGEEYKIDYISKYMRYEDKFIELRSICKNKYKKIKASEIINYRLKYNLYYICRNTHKIKAINEIHNNFIFIAQTNKLYRDDKGLIEEDLSNLKWRYSSAENDYYKNKI